MIDSEQRNALIVYIVKDISIFYQEKGEFIFFCREETYQHIILDWNINNRSPVSLL